jgi:bifunctional UDP-N-acetylglucosamine pyrophosphorylase/glucosamine-1-phosphate N-acetyltransferase
MAAGKGTRMKSLDINKSKVAYSILGVPLVQYVLDALKPLSLDQSITIVGFGGETTQSIVKDQTSIVWQRDQKGTGHAIMQCAPILEGKEGLTLIVSGDTPLLTTETLQKLVKKHENDQSDLTILTSIVPNPKGYGRILRNAAQGVEAIVEQADATEVQLAIQEVNTGVYVFNNVKLFQELKNITPSNKQGEYYLTDVIKLFSNKKYKISAEILSNYEEMLGINDRVQLAEAAKILQKRINDVHMRAGVTIEAPDHVFIGPYVAIGPDTCIKPGTTILGKSLLGEANTIGPDSNLEDVTLGKRNTIIQSKISRSSLLDDNQVGPYAHIREYTVIHHQTRIGNFVEVKKCIIHNGVKASHLSYLGDAEIFDNTNIGAGVITANYDGHHKHKTVIGKDVFVGSGVTIIAPVTIGDRVVVAAGSTITEDIPTGELGIARSQQTNKPNYYDAWVKKTGK